jgi:hypothetical protein
MNTKKKTIEKTMKVELQTLNEHPKKNNRRSNKKINRGKWVKL